MRFATPQVARARDTTTIDSQMCSSERSERTDRGKSEPIPEEALGRSSRAITSSIVKWENARGICRRAGERPRDAGSRDTKSRISQTASVNLV